MGSDVAAPIVVYDACVLYRVHLRNIAVQCAVDGLVRPRWPDGIHEEWMRSVLAAKPHLGRGRLEHLRGLIDGAVPDALVRGHLHLVPSIFLPDPGDRHVVAAAIQAGAEAIVTADRHFRADDLKPHGLSVWTPDEFMLRLYRAGPAALLASLATSRLNLTRTNPTVEGFVSGLRRTGVLGEFCRILDRRLGAL